MFRPLTSHLATRLQPASNFGGAVYDVDEFPIMPASQQPAPKVPEIPSLRNLVLEKLAATSPGTRTLRNQKVVLTTEASSFKVSLIEVDEYLAACLAEVEGVLRSQHRAIRTKGRQQLAMCDKLNEAFVTANQSWNVSTECKARAIDEVRQAEYSRERLSRWSWTTDAELLAADKKISEAKDIARVSIQVEVEALQARSTAEQVLSEARAELVRLAAEEKRFRKMLSGESYVDPEFGLTVPARS